MGRGDLRVKGFRFLPVVTLSVVLGAAACGSAEDGQPAQEQAAEAEGTPAASEPEAQQGAPDGWLQGFTVGSRVDTTGAIPREARADEFRIGEPIYIALELGEAPPPASVHAVFYDGSGRKVAEDAKKVPARAPSLYFDSGDTGEWAPGEGRISISVDGRRVGEEPFTLVATTSAGGAAD